MEKTGSELRFVGWWSPLLNTGKQLHFIQLHAWLPISFLPVACAHHYFVKLNRPIYHIKVEEEGFALQVSNILDD